MAGACERFVPEAGTEIDAAVLADRRGEAEARWRERWAARAEVARRPDAAGLYLALAPMDGVTDAVYRGLLTGLNGGRSGISVCVSEFVRVTRDPAPAAVLRRDVPELMVGGRTAAGVPVFVQLLGGDAEPVARTAQVAASLGAPGIDLNFGCPAKTVNNHDGGATLLKYPERIRRIVERTRELVPHEIPVTMKMRVGWDSAEGIEAIADGGRGRRSRVDHDSRAHAVAAVPAAGGVGRAGPGAGGGPRAGGRQRRRVRCVGRARVRGGELLRGVHDRSRGDGAARGVRGDPRRRG
jgi:hypothetical protein